MLKIGVTMYETSFPTRDARLKTPAPGEYPLTDVLFANHVTPVLLPTVSPNRFIIHRFINKIDGLILGGGDDIDPRTYHELPIESSLNYPMRDKFENRMIKAAIRNHRPILGVCRGSQMINVSLGGTLYQNIYQQIHNRKLINHQFSTHQVDIRPGSYLGRIMGDRLIVNSRHHQAIKTLGKNLCCVARAPDGIIEGIESHDGLIQGVQWHPENLWQKDHKQLRLFQFFLSRVENNKNRLG